MGLCYCIFNFKKLFNLVTSFLGDFVFGSQVALVMTIFTVAAQYQILSRNYLQATEFEQVVTVKPFNSTIRI